jgi:hypothetical protein
MSTIWFAGRKDSSFPLGSDDLILFDNFELALEHALAAANRSGDDWVVIRAERLTLH